MTTILVVEDDADVRKMVRMTLEREGYQVVEAPSGRIALERYRESPVDLVVTDMLMPRMTGLELITKLRQEFPESRILAISGSREMLAAAHRGAGAVETLDKPFSRTVLVETVRQMLAGEE